jgi:hypothetical protein
MSEAKDPVREYLLGQAPHPSEGSDYRETVRKILQHNEKRLRLERVLANAAWIFCALLAAFWIWSSDGTASAGRAPFLACIFLIIGAVEILKHQINSCRTGLMAELKQLQVQLFDLEQRVPKQPN